MPKLRQRHKTPVCGKPSKHETALAARQKGSKQKKTKAMCTDCSKTGHTIEKCWEPGGGSEGKALDWFKNAKARKNGSGEKPKK